MGKLTTALFVVCLFAGISVGAHPAHAEEPQVNYCVTDGQVQQQGNQWLIPVMGDNGDGGDLICNTSSPSLPSCDQGQCDDGDCNYGALPSGCSVY